MKKKFYSLTAFLLVTCLFANLLPARADELYPDREVVFGNEFNADSEIAGSTFGISSRTVNGGIGTFVPSGDNGVYFTTPLFDAAGVDRIAIRLKAGAAAVVKMYFVPNGTAAGEDKTYTFRFPASDDFQTVYVGATTNANWKGQIKQYRLSLLNADWSPAAGKSFEIDFVRFYSGAETWPDPSDELYPDRQLLYGNEFATASELSTWREGFSSVGVTDGYAKFVYEKTPANFYYSNAFSFSAALCNLMAIRVKSSVPISVTMYFTTSTEPNASEDKKMSISIPASEDWRLVTLNPSTHVKWTDNITRYRFDFGRSEPNTVQLDFVRFYSAVMPSYTEDARRISYDFSINKANDGFTGNGGVSDVAIYNGALWAKISGAGAYFTTASAAYAAKAEDIPQIRISYRNRTSGTTGKLYFATDSAPEYGEERVFSFPISPNASEEYVINTVDNTLWKGSITGLRLEPADAPGSVQLDFIRLEKFPCSISAHDGIIRISGNLYGLEGKTLSVSARNTQTGDVGYSGQTQTGASGVFSFSFDIENQMSEPSSYDLLFSGSELTGTVKKRITYVPHSYINGIVEEINTAKAEGSISRLQTLIEENYGLLPMQCAFYEVFAAVGLYKDEFYTALAASGAAAGLSVLESQIDGAVVFARMNHMTAGQWLEAVDGYDAYLGFKSLPAYSTYAKATEAGQKAVAEKMSAGGHTDFTAARDTFQKQVVLVGLKRAVGWGDVKDILQTNAALLGVGFTAVNNLKNPSEAYRQLTEREFETLEDAKKAFNDAVAEQAKKESGSNSGDSGSGGSRGSIGTTAIVGMPPPSVVIPETEHQVDTPFADLDGFDWTLEAIRSLYQRNIISGTGNGHFEPMRDVTREEFVKMLVVSVDLPLSDSAAFADVIVGEWYAPYIGAAVSAGIARGQNEYFGIGQTLTRQDAAVMAARVLGLTGGPGTSDFADYGEIADYAKAAVGLLTQAGFLKGYEDNSFRPDSSITRAEAAVVLYRIIGGMTHE